LGIIQQRSRHDIESHDTSIRSILLQIKDRGISTIEPVFERNQGFGYPVLEEYDFIKQLSILDQMEREGFFLTAELFDSVLQCPNCSSTEFSLRLSCTVCKSTNVTRGSVIEHLSCGNIDFDDKFLDEMDINGNSQLACGKCGKRLKAIGVDYARPGVFYRCLSCKALLPEIENNYTCFRCAALWKKDQLKELRLMKYTVDLEKVSNYFVKHNFLPIVAEALRSRHGIVAQAPGKVKGLSKIEHSFDLLISDQTTGDPVLVADLVLNNDANYSNSHQPDGMHVLAFYAKCLDTSFSSKNIIKKILVVPSGLPDDAAGLASAYSILAVEPTDPENMVSFILEVLRMDEPS
jgi:hypothetical protein